MSIFTTRPMRNIHTNKFSYQVIFFRNKKTNSKAFNYKTCGGKRKALEAAKQWRDEQEKILPEPGQPASESGVVGVHKYRGYWRASGVGTITSFRAQCMFSINKYGDAEAKRRAIEWRKKHHPRPQLNK